MLEEMSGRLGALPISSSFMVHRGRMIRDLVLKGQNGDILVIAAPNGFGKTSMLLQYTEEVRSDPARGAVKIIEGERGLAQEISMQLEVLLEELKDEVRPLVAIDNMPLLDRGEAEDIVKRLRWLRDGGCGVLVTCEPSNRELLRALGDSVKVTAQMLKVHPYEYADWARAFGISSSFDVYGLTQGVPELVAALQAGIEQHGNADTLLTSGILDVYGSLLAELSRAKTEPLLALVCMMLLMGKGEIGELERCGMNPSNEDLSHLVRDYPMFGYEPADRTFECLGTDDARWQVCKVIAGIRPEYVMRAARVLMRAGRIDRAVDLAEAFMKRPSVLELVKRFGPELALSGHAGFVCRAVLDGPQDNNGEIGLEGVLALYMAALTRGETKLVKRAAARIREEYQRVSVDVDSRSWGIARALSDLWAPDQESRLPALDMPAAGSNPLEKLLRAHERAYRDFLLGEGHTDALERLPVSPLAHCEVDLAGILISCDRLMQQVVEGSMGGPENEDRDIEELRPVLEKRGMAPVVSWTRCVVSARRLLAGRPVVDEQAFCDAGRYGVRAHDEGLQLFCMVMEGWQYLERSQPVNAKFRAVQALRLAQEGYPYLRWVALMLERVSALRNTSLVTVREEAELIDLDRADVDPVDVWISALHLACAGRDSDLSAWMSMHRAELLEPRCRLFARLGMHCLGPVADLVRRKLPAAQIARYSLETDEDVSREPLFQVVGTDAQDMTGQVELRLLGGFRAILDGHLITEKMWRRKKAAVLAARLALAAGAQVDRIVLEQELWPHADAERAKNNLYSTISVLRKTLGMSPDGESSVLVQSDGISLNASFVHTDIKRFQQIAREVLVSKKGISGPYLVELCLKLEQLYAGPLYVPGSCDPTYFVRQRRIMQSKFIDCMIKGALTAMEENDLQSAVWLVESGLRQDSTREDLLRAGMRIYDLAGRRRDIVEIYNGHLHYLNEQFGGLPEPETRKLYERIVGQRMKRSIL